MLRLGTIGTSVITVQFTTEALRSGLYEWTALYSRKIETATTCAGENDPKIFTDFQEFANSDLFDVAYVASPNVFHKEQIQALLEGGKDVICEKPIVQSKKDLEDLYALAEEKGLRLVEGARHIYEKNFRKVKDFLNKSVEENKVTGAKFSYCQYSSKQDAYLRGETPNIFNPKIRGGALNDLGIYLVYAAVSFFGKPETAHYCPQLLRTGIDGSGMISLGYGDYSVYLHPSKTYASRSRAEVYLGKETLRLNRVEMIEDYVTLSGEKIEALEGFEEIDDRPLKWEVVDFHEIFTKKQETKDQYEEVKELALDVVEVMDELRTYVKYD